MSKTNYPDGHQDGELLSQLVDDMHINHSGKMVCQPGSTVGILGNISWVEIL